MFRLDLQPASPTPIYRQIVEQITRAVAAGTLAPGDALPSVRAVAQDHVVNPMTVSKAYSLLEAQGVVERRRGVGMAVAASATGAPDRFALLAPALEHAAKVARQLGIDPEDALRAFAQTLADSEQEKNHE
ncbi:MAG: GntR family transcriptional regulator [Burkholderiales bacterium]|nr:GntR family transcriptional regulator [Burkholderiales bacterium]